MWWAREHTLPSCPHVSLKPSWFHHELHPSNPAQSIHFSKALPPGIIIVLGLHSSFVNHWSMNCYIRFQCSNICRSLGSKALCKSWQSCFRKISAFLLHLSSGSSWLLSHSWMWSFLPCHQYESVAQKCVSWRHKAGFGEIYLSLSQNLRETQKFRNQEK